MKSANQRQYRLRFVIIANIVRVTILDSENWTCFIAQPAWFYAVTGAEKGKVLGTVSVSADKLAILTGRKGVDTHDARTIQFA
jgi:hypothetical protein